MSKQTLTVQVDNYVVKAHGGKIVLRVANTGTGAAMTLSLTPAQAAQLCRLLESESWSAQRGESH